jgi:ferredoxin-type protein NapH
MLNLALVIGMMIPVTVALLFGRVFCSWICPISFISECVDTLIRLFSGRRYRRDGFRLPRRILWLSLVMELLLAMVAGVPIFVFLSPPGLVGREIMMAVLFKTLAIEGVIIIFVVLLHIVTPRFFCRYLCPLGSLLALIGIRRRMYVRLDSDKCNGCKQCRYACPLGLSPYKGESMSAYCWNCGECIDTCKTGSLSYGWRSPSPFNEFLFYKDDDN